MKESGSVKATLWCEPKTGRLIKRVIEIDNRRVTGTFTETYTTFILDADIADEQFKVPRNR